MTKRKINVQKALSYPHCTGNMATGDSRCAVGSVISGILGDIPISTAFCIGNVIVEAMSNEAAEIIEDIFALDIPLNQVALINDHKDTTDTDRDNLRKWLITELVKTGQYETECDISKSFATECNVLAI